MLSLSAAACAPLRIRSQNESPGTSWVIIATVTRGVLACPAPMPPPDSWGLPPVDEHDATPSITLAPAMAASRVNLIVSPLYSCAAWHASGVDVIRLTDKSQEFVLTLGLHVKC
jgi:hypothetical protein